LLLIAVILRRGDASGRDGQQETVFSLVASRSERDVKLIVR
jgi:hypothetical protein